jgi:hypothetical protein
MVFYQGTESLAVPVNSMNSTVDIELNGLRMFELISNGLHWCMQGFIFQYVVV